MGIWWCMSLFWDIANQFGGDTSRLKLFSDTKIVRFAGLKLDKNPYIDQDYFNLWNRCPILKGL